MDNVALEVNPEASIQIEAVSGDLRVIGWDQPSFTAESDEDNSLRVNKQDDIIHLKASADCTVRLPHQARLVIGRVGTDAHIKTLDNPLTIERVSGDLILRQMGAVSVGQVGGDLSAKKLNGALSAGQVSGDLSARGVNGDFSAGKIGGDVYLRDVEGGVAVNASGDVTLAVAFTPEHAYAVQAGGDLVCRLEPTAAATFSIQAGGGVTVDVLGATIEGGGGKRRVAVGGGGPEVALRASGDVTLTGLAVDPEAMGEFGERFGDNIGLMAEEFATQIESQIEAQMADFEKNFTERMAGIDFGAGRINAEEIAAKARRAAEKVERATHQKAEAAKRRVEAAQRRAEAHVDRAQRLAEAAQERAQRRGPSSFTFGFGPRPPVPPRPPSPARPPVPPTPPGEAVSEEERMVILRMLEQGKISVADAEKLLAALESK
ncbi:MAG: hypothetical protein ABI847_11585 [Anaerolineales bacterium]